MLSSETLDHSEHFLLALPMEVYVAFMTVLAVVIGVMYWLMSSMEKKRRRIFIEIHDPAALRLNRHSRNIVYQILETSEGIATAVLVWRDKYPVKDDPAFRAEVDQFSAFDSESFTAGISG